jgi:hypothetical protein
MVSSPRSTRYHSLDRQSSPVPDTALPEKTYNIHAVSTHPTGGSLASETSSAGVTPASVRSLLSTLNEQIAAQRTTVDASTSGPPTRDPAPASESSSVHHTPMTAHTTLPHPEECGINGVETTTSAQASADVYEEPAPAGSRMNVESTTAGFDYSYSAYQRISYCYIPL